MTVVVPNTGLLITCEPWEYAELCKQHGWIKTTYETNTTPIQKYEVGEIPSEQLEKQKKQRPYLNKDEEGE